MRKLAAWGLGIFFLSAPYTIAAPAPSATAPAALSAATDGAAQRIGVVAAVKGTVKIAKAGKAGEIAGSGQPIFIGDEVRTDDKGTLQILLLDETVFTIGPSSAIVIDQFIYDPKTETGVVNAKVVSGVFRFVTGKIARKKPSQMNVDLPSGTIGIRGTMVAGESVGEKSLVVLLGPGAQHNTQHHQGSIVVTNGGKSVDVSRAGFGAVIEGTGIPPKAVFQVPAADISRINAALEPPPANDDEEESQEQNQGSASDQAGQTRAQAGGEVKENIKDGRIFRKFAKESEQAAQKNTESNFTKILDGPTSRNQLDIAAQKSSGVFHFSQTGVKIFDSSIQQGTYDFQYDIDFGSRKVGGGQSKLTIKQGSQYAPSSDQAFTLGLKNFGVGSENAEFRYVVPNGVSTGGGCVSFGCSATIDVGINNRGGIIAADANHSLRLNVNNPPQHPLEASGSGVAQRFDGAST